MSIPEFGDPVSNSLLNKPETYISSVLSIAITVPLSSTNSPLFFPLNVLFQLESSVPVDENFFIVQAVIFFVPLSNV